jgi:uncharacterized protein YpmB
MKRKPPARWLVIMVLIFMAVVYISWLVYRHYMNLLEFGK